MSVSDLTRRKLDATHSFQHTPGGSYPLPALPHIPAELCGSAGGKLSLAWNVRSPVATQEIYDGSNKYGVTEGKQCL